MKPRDIFTSYIGSFDSSILLGGRPSHLNPPPQNGIMIPAQYTDGLDISRRMSPWDLTQSKETRHIK